MKANTKNIMKSNWEAENMMRAWKFDGSNSCFPSGKCLNSKNSRRSYRRMLKNKWRKEIRRQFNEELEEVNNIFSNIVEFKCKQPDRVNKER